jgi:hypothetical protein
MSKEQPVTVASAKTPGAMRPPLDENVRMSRSVRKLSRKGNLNLAHE